MSNNTCGIGIKVTITDALCGSCFGIMENTVNQNVDGRTNIPTPRVIASIVTGNITNINIHKIKFSVIIPIIP